MALIPLMNGGFAEVDDTDADVVLARKWNATRIRGSRTLYARASGPYTPDALMHRLIMAPPDGLVVDHIDGNGLNNRRSNLRLCTRAQNLANRARQLNSSSPYKGVVLRRHKFLRKPWAAQIGGHGDHAHLGQFATAEEAAAAYDIAAVLRYGEFACLNFPHVFPEVFQRKA